MRGIINPHWKLSRKWGREEKSSRFVSSTQSSCGMYTTNEKLMPIGVGRGGGDRGMFKSLQFVGGVGVSSLCVQVSI